MIDTFKNQMPNKKPRPTRLDSSVYAFVWTLLFTLLFFFFQLWSPNFYKQ